MEILKNVLLLLTIITWILLKNSNGYLVQLFDNDNKYYMIESNNEVLNSNSNLSHSSDHMIFGNGILFLI